MHSTSIYLKGICNGVGFKLQQGSCASAPSQC
jgi:hypothetical protein